MLSAHIRNNNYWKSDISNLKTFIVLRHEIIFPYTMTVLALLCMYKKTPLPNLEKELMMEVHHLLKNMEEGGLFPSPLFFLF